MINKNLKNWFVLYTKPRQELKVLDRLSCLGFEVYTPTKIEIRKWSDRRKKVIVALLPSMVLVCLEEKEAYKVFEVTGVRRYLFVNGIRARVSNAEVLAMKEYVEGAYCSFDEKKILLGSVVNVPILNQKAEIIYVKGKRCIARLEMLGAQVSFQLK